MNRGDEKVGAGVTFQPVMPISLYGEGDADMEDDHAPRYSDPIQPAHPERVQQFL